MKQWIDVNGAALRCEVLGEGAKTLVLVHEMGGSLDSWDQALDLLLPGRRVLRYDTRGAGQSEKLREPPTFDVMADDVAALLDALGITGKVAIAGSAVGGGIALHFAVRHAARTAATIAMSPAFGVPAAGRATGLARAAMVERVGMRAVVDATFANSYPPQVRHDLAQYETFRTRWMTNDPSSYANITRMLAAADIEAGFASIACPALLLGAAEDPLRTPAMVEEVARAIPGARYQVVATGHYWAVQTPALVARTITAFLDEVGA
jgi:3-oxoadipate enol-lactonase